ncbi:MAG: amidohydrolase family protein [Myxococcota bacterium]|nr:amidohydrolase family protein [Myxococcota bacterium]
MPNETWDLVIKNGRVVDGTGLAAFHADIAVKDGRIARIGRADGPAAKTIDADGALVTPGFIDVHTHYDVQLDWDPTASPSAWHGVTTVLTGNCGFTLAPSKPEDVPWLAGMLSRVEGMSKEALAEGFTFAGGSFDDFWSRLEGKIGVNAAGYVGHCAVRRYVMGDDASERECTSEELEAMKELVRQSMREGAIGFSTSQLDLHVGEDGREVPCNHASRQEIIELCSVLAEFDYGAIEIIPRSHAEGHDEADRAMLLEMYAVSGKPIELGILAPTPNNPMAWQNTLDFVRESAAGGARIHPQFTTQKLGLHLKLADTFVFDEMPEWRSVLTSPEPSRSEQLRDPVVRARLQTEWDSPEVRNVAFDLGELEVEATHSPEFESRVGRSLQSLADERGASVLDTFLDISLEEELQTSFQIATSDAGREFMAHVVSSTIADPLVMAGSSDGGAHLASFVGADYTTRLITDWVPDVLSLEQAVWRLAGMPAAVHGLVDRGTLRVGAKADINIIDLDTLKAGDNYLARDFPADTERYVVDAEGYIATIVNGEVLMEHGKYTGATPGEVIRGA